MKPRLIEAKALMDYCLNQKTKTIDCNDIARFPSATVEPERPKGKWVWKERNKGAIDYVTGKDTETGETRTIQVDSRHVVKRNYCSLCGKIGDDTFMNYCPNCGADMRER